VTVPKYGILGQRHFRPVTEVVDIRDGYIHFDRSVQIKAAPMIGTIGVTPTAGKIATAFLGRHGGNMDTKEVGAGTNIYFPVFTRGAMFSAGDIHAVQADGELCVSAIEVAGEALLKFDLIKNKEPEWPVLETRETYMILSCGDSLDEAARLATETATKAVMREHHWSFEKAYMFGSLGIDLKINQAVDLKKGVRATISKDYVTLDSLLA
jgi:amidase